MQIVIPMAGTGDRYLRAGYTEPKPLIKVAGKPMIQYIIEMFPGEEDFLFICNKEHLANTELREVLLSLKPGAKIVGIDSHKLGPVYTVMQASDHIKKEEPCVVNYCDFDTKWDYQNFKKTMEESGCDGCITCYKGFHPHLLGPNFYASVKTDENDYMIEIREKHSFTENKMDSWQSSGCYYFKSGEIVKKYFQQLMDEEITCSDEYFVCLIYNLLQDDGLRTLVYPLKYFCQWGTPEDLREWEYWAGYFGNE